MQIETPPTEKRYDKAEGERRGLVIVNTGDGKGKSTAAFGLALRAHGRGKAVKVYQFMKVPSARFGEHRMFEQIGLPIEGLGDGFSWKSKDLEHSAQLARDGSRIAYVQDDELYVVDAAGGLPGRGDRRVGIAFRCRGGRRGHQKRRHGNDGKPRRHCEPQHAADWFSLPGHAPLPASGRSTVVFLNPATIAISGDCLSSSTRTLPI